MGADAAAGSEDALERLVLGVVLLPVVMLLVGAVVVVPALRALGALKRGLRRLLRR